MNSAYLSSMTGNGKNNKPAASNTSVYTLDDLGQIPRLSAPQEPLKPLKTATTIPNGYGRTDVRGEQQQQYQQQTQQLQAQEQQWKQNSYNTPLLTKNEEDPNPPSGYITNIREDEEQNSSGQHFCVQWIEELRELSKLEGRTPLCKAFTYINVLMVLFIFYLILKAF